MPKKTPEQIKEAHIKKLMNKALYNKRPLKQKDAEELKKLFEEDPELEFEFRRKKYYHQVGSGTYKIEVTDKDLKYKCSGLRT